MRRLIAVLAGLGLAIASTHPLSAGVASAPATNSTEQSGVSPMRQPLIMLARDYHSIASGLARATKSPLVRPNASTLSFGPASRVHGTTARGLSGTASRIHGTAARGSLPAAARRHGNTAKNSSRKASHGRDISRSRPTTVPSANQGTPGSPGSPGSFGRGTGQSDAVAIPDPNSRRTGASDNSPHVPGDDERSPGVGLSSGQDVIEFLNNEHLRPPNLPPGPSLSPSIAKSAVQNKLY